MFPKLYHLPVLLEQDPRSATVSLPQRSHVFPVDNCQIFMEMFAVSPRFQEHWSKWLLYLGVGPRRVFLTIGYSFCNILKKSVVQSGSKCDTE